MKEIIYPATFHKVVKDSDYFQVTIPNIGGGYASGRGIKGAREAARNLLLHMVEEYPEECFKPETLEEIQARFPERKVENIVIEVDDETYKIYKEQMIPETDEISIDVVLFTEKESQKTKIIFPCIDIEPDYADNPELAVDKSREIIKSVIKDDVYKIHAPIYRQGELRKIYPGTAVFWMTVPISRENKEIILNNYVEINTAIKLQHEIEILDAFDFNFFSHKHCYIKALSKQLFRVYEEVNDKKIFVHLMEKVLDLYASRINEEYLRELPIPYLFALNEYDLANEYLSLIKGEPKDPYTNFLRGVYFFYKKEYIHSKYYFLLIKDNPEFKEETDKFFALLKKVMPSNNN